MKALLSRLIEPRAAGVRPDSRFTNAALKAMIIPLMIEQLLQLIVGIADTMMVSYAGEATVSGVSLDTMIYTIFIYMFTAVATGGAVIVSQYIGSRDRRQADQSASQVFFLAGAVSLAFMALVLLAGNSILALLYPSVEPAVMEACKTYLWIVTLSFPANAIYNAGAAMYRSMGKTKVTMKISIAMNLLNVVGNAVGIFALRAGAAGVAWPTTLSWYFAAIVMTRLCFRENNDVTLRAAHLFRPEKEMLSRILHVALPNAAENTLFQLAKVVLGSLIATFGTAQIAANGIGQTIWSLAALISIAMGSVFITVIGQCIGAGDEEAADYYMRKLTRLSLVLCIVWNILILAITPLLIPLYNISDEAKYYVWVIVIIHNVFCAIAQPFSASLSSGLRAAGDVKFTMYTSIFCTVVFRTLLSFLLGKWMGMGVIGIALAMGLDWCLKGILDIIRFRNGKWRGHKVI